MFRSYVSTANPGYFVFIIDQSARMNEPYVAGTTKADYAATQINRVINELININMDGERTKDRFFISLIGHSNGVVNDIRSDYLSSFADNPLRLEQLKKKVSDGAGGMIEIDVVNPIFIEPLATGIEDELAAIEFSKELVEGWMNRKDYLSIAIFNNSGGYPKDWKEITTIVNGIKDLRCNKTKVVMCNMLIESNKKSLVFPTIEEIFNQSFSTQIYFEWSTYFPPDCLRLARRQDYEMDAHNKMFVNQNLTEIIKFIDTGS
jgi:hypothetical protein